MRTVEAAHEALQQEFDRVQIELESSEAMVGELEQELEEERRKGEEEVGRCETLIVELQGQLEASEEQCRTEKAKVGGTSGTLRRGCRKRVGRWGYWGIQGEGQREGKGSCDAVYDDVGREGGWGMCNHVGRGGWGMCNHVGRCGWGMLGEVGTACGKRWVGHA